MRLFPDNISSSCVRLVLSSHRNAEVLRGEILIGWLWPCPCRVCSLVHIDIWLRNARLLFLGNVLFMPIYELLSKFISIDWEPFFLKILWLLLVDNPTQNLPACFLVFHKDLLGDQSFDLWWAALVDPCLAPKLWLLISHSCWVFDLSHCWPLRLQIMGQHLCVFAADHLAHRDRLLHVKARLVCLEREHLPLDLSAIKPVLALLFLI